MTVINRRYQLISKIDDDKYGEIFHGIDLTSQKKPLHVKMIHNDHYTDDMYRYFSQEFIKLAALDHPGLLSAYRFDAVTSLDSKQVDNKQYFIVTEYYDANQSIPYKHLSAKEKFDVLVEVLYVMRFIHFRGLVYGFLCEDTLVIQEQDGKLKVKLKDFSSLYGYLEKTYDRSHQMTQHLAPEVLRGKAPQKTSDIYSLASLLMPVVEALSDKRNDMDYLALINALEFALLEEPNNRLKSLDEMTQALVKAKFLTFDFKDRAYYERLNFNTKLIGRNRELLLVKQQISDRLESRQGNIGALVKGVPGIGKSRFIREVAYDQRMLGRRVIYIDCEDEEQGEFRIFTKVMTTMIRMFEIPTSLINKYGQELVKLIPEMITIWDVKPSDSLRDERERLKLNNRVASFIEDMAQQHGMVLILDNVDLMSTNEKAILESLYRSNDRVSLYVISACDLDPFKEQEGDEFNEFSLKYQKINLEGFPVGLVADYLQDVLFTEQKPYNLASLIVDDASGNPRYIEEVVKHLYMNKYIYIGDNRKWHILDGGYKVIDMPQTLNEVTLASIQTFDEASKHILETIAIFGLPVSKELLSQLSGYSHQKFIQRVNKMIKLKILQIKYFDWGYTYDFYNRHLAKLIYESIDHNTRTHMHGHVAQVLEDHYLDHGTYSEGLIKHYYRAGLNEKAIAYALELGDAMNDRSLYKKALEYYHQALDMFEGLKDQGWKARIVKAIADINFSIGESKEAYKLYNELVALASDQGMYMVKIDALNKLIDIMINKKLVDGLELMIEEVKMTCMTQGYTEGLLDLGLLEVRHLLSKGLDEAAAAIVADSLTMAKSIDNDYYVGRYLNARGIYQNYQGKHDEAFKSFLSALTYIEHSGNASDLSRINNNLGVIALDVMGEVTKAKEYFLKALDLIKSCNEIDGRNTYLSNVGEACAAGGEIKEAIAYFQEAEKLSEDTEFIDGILLSTLNLIDAYLTLRNYKEAYRYMEKFELLFDTHKEVSVNIGIDRYYYLKIQFYLRMRDFKQVHFALSELQHGGFEATDGPYHLKERIQKFVIQHIESGRRTLCEVDMNNLLTLVKLVGHPLEAQQVKQTLLDLVIDMLCFNCTHPVDDLMRLVNTLPFEDESRVTALKLKTIQVVTQGQKVAEHIQETLVAFDDVINSENRWLMHMLAANDYFGRADYFNALRYYLEVLDVIHDQMISVPKSLQDTYILGDELRMKVKRQVSKLSARLSLIDDGPKTDAITTKAYFDIGYLNQLFETDKFKQSISNAYTLRYGVTVEDTTSLLKLFKEDQQFNIQLVLKYLTKVTLADFGLVMIMDEDKVLEEAFTSDGQDHQDHIQAIMRQYYELDEGLVVENRDKLSVDRASKDNEAYMLVPIRGENTTAIKDHRRKYDEEDEHYKRHVGYLYLSSNTLLNNICSQTFEEVSALMTLLYVLSENYRLKKLSSVDKLTGVFLRKFIEAEFNKHLVISRAQGYEMSVIMADIDHFKTVNDTYGHRKGDEVLFNIGQIMRQTVRQGDYVGRYGGEEFIILLPKTGAIAAYEVGEKIRKTINNRKLLGEGHPLTISLGVATYPKMGNAQEELIERADQALYESKNQGRNRTTLYDESLKSGGQRYDKLTGILTGNVSNDARIIKALIDVVELIAQPLTKEEKILQAMKWILDITLGTEAALLTVQGDKLKSYEHHRGQNGFSRKRNIKQTELVTYYQENEDHFFIKWNDVGDIDNFTGIPNWKSYIVCPLIVGGQARGTLVVRVPIKDMEFEFKHYNFVKRLSGVIATLLDA